MKNLRTKALLASLLTVGFMFVATYDVKAEESNSSATVAPQNVSVEGVDVSGMSADEVQAVIDNYLSGYSSANFTLVAGEKQAVASASNLSISSKNAYLADEVVNYGNRGGLISRYKAQVDSANGTGKDFQISLASDTKAIKEYLDNNSDKLNEKAKNSTLSRENGEFKFVKGAAGVEVLTNQSAAAINSFVCNEWTGGDATINLITEVVEPKGKEEDLVNIKDCLGSYSTDFHTSSTNRAKNVTNGASKINGTVLYPGEVLSVYETVSPFSAENGYALAGSYENGTTVETYGGGICQVSTTLYNAVMRAELEIVTRSAHSMIVSYVEPSMDAAIAGTAKDFQFRNSYDTPIYIEGYTSGGMIYFNIFGKETRDKNRTVEFVSEVLSTTEPVNEFSIDPALPVGTITKTNSAHTGYTAKLWKIIKVNGVETERIVYNNSTYRVSNATYAVGTGGADAAAAAAIEAAVGTQDEANIRGTVDSIASGVVPAAENPYANIGI